MHIFKRPVPSIEAIIELLNSSEKIRDKTLYLSRKFFARLRKEYQHRQRIRNCTHTLSTVRIGI